MNLRERIARFPVRRTLAWAAGAAVAWILLGFLAVPALVKGRLPPLLSAKLHRPVTLKEARFNPFTLALTLEGFAVGEREGPGTLLSFERLYANLQLASVFYRGAVLSEVVLVAPSVSVARTGPDSYSVSDLIEELSKEEPGKEPARFSVANIRIERGTIAFDDRPAKTKHVVSDLKVGIPFVSNLPVDHELFTEPYLGAKVNGAPFALKGKTKPFAGSRETTLDIDLSDVDIPFYTGYRRFLGEARLRSGRLDTKLVLAFRQNEKKEPAVVLSGSAALREILYEDAAKAPLFGFKRVGVVLASADVFRREVRLKSLTVETPEAWISRDREGGYPIAEKFLGTSRPAPATKAAEAKGAGAAPTASFLVEVASATLANGKLHYRDEHPRRPFESVVSEIAVELGDVSTAKGKVATLKASARTEDGAKMEHVGRFSLDPQASEGELRGTGFPLRRYAPFYEDVFLFGFESGTLDVSTKYRWPVAGGTTALSDLAVSLHDVRARRKGEKEDFLRIPAASMTGTSVDPERKVVAVGSISAPGPFLRVVRGKDGGIDLASLMAAPPAPAPATAPAGKADAKAKAKGEAREDGPPWTARLGSLSIEKATVRFADEAAPRPVALVFSPASLTGQGLSTAKGEKGKLGARFVLNGKGSVALSGTVAASPAAADLRVDVKELDLTSFAGYFPERVLLTLASGTLSAEGTARAAQKPDGTFSAGYAGNVTCARLKTVDPTTSDDFLRWDALYFGKMNATWNPLSFTAERMSLTDLFARVELYPDGTLNYQKVLGLAEPPPVDDQAAASAAGPPAKNGEASAPAAPPAEVPEVRIDTVTLQGGEIHLDDRFVKPSYRARMVEVGGRVSGLSSVPGTRAEVDLRGRLESFSPLEIKGTVNPLSATAFAEITASFRDIDLVPMTPYFVKYTGYAVQKGRLTMNVEYKLEERRLSAKNGFLVDQFTFGEKVESPTATKLPVKLGVSLLKGPDGVIRLDVPISGSVDDPKFRVGPIIWKVLGNLLLKAVSSPFSLLGSMFGGGRELSYVDFSPGQARLGTEATKTLEALSTALAKRPALKLDVEGKVDPEKDAEGLKRVRYERKVKARKAEELAKKGTPAASVDDVSVSKEEWPEYLLRAYGKESFPKPRTALGLVKEIPPDEMEKLMLAHSEVSADDLRQLALDRAEGVRSWLLGPGKVPADRVFLTEPVAAPAAPPKPGDSLTRAVFVLK